MTRPRPLGLSLGTALLALGAWGLVRLAQAPFRAPDAEVLPASLASLPEGPVLGVFAHPDDEILASALFARAAAGGRMTALYTATRGEAGTQMPVIARQSDLGHVRKAEALKHSFSLGVAAHTVDAFPDGGLAETPASALEAVIAAELDAIDPAILVTFWPESGVSMHADHRRIGAAAQRVARARARAGHGPVVILYVLAPDQALRRFGGARGQEVADAQPAATHALRADASAKRRAWRIHASQADYVQASYGMPDWLLYALWRDELYALEPLEGALDRTEEPSAR